ncbi:DUF5808 domain-containing protein [Flavobacterium flavipallidum]|uniref:DUF5808 domain-containing protein n=1 Tax=Flavobacterium flavipallidum TaxID=3139140 RepID=A0ABU9HJH3_9FLAO
MEDPNNPSKETLEKWSKDPNNWIWGMFYFNPKDKRFFPPKKKEWMGWTVNFANRKSVLFFIGMLLFFLFVTFTILRKN